MTVGVERTLTNAIPALFTKVKCPSNTVPICPSNDTEVCVYADGNELLSVSVAIQHLNDEHKWTREAIADWLDTLDVDLTFPAEPVKAVANTRRGPLVAPGIDVISYSDLNVKWVDQWYMKKDAHNTAKINASKNLVAFELVLEIGSSETNIKNLLKMYTGTTVYDSLTDTLNLEINSETGDTT